MRFPRTECPIGLEIAIVLVLILLNGVFAGAEIAILSVRRTRLRELAEEGSTRATAAIDLRAHPERFLATVQIGISVISATAAAFGGSRVAADIAPYIARVPFLAAEAEEIALALIIAAVAYLSLVLGELVPKSLALRSAESYALWIATPLAAVAWLARPLVWFLTASSNCVLRLFGDRTSFTETRYSSEELQQLVDEAASAGPVDPDVGEIASRALDLHDLDVSAVMVPRRALVAVPRKATIADIAAITRDKGIARVLVHEGDLDKITGYLAVRDALAAAVLQPVSSVEPYVRPVPFVPETMAATAVLKQLQAQGVPLAVVVDEQGTVLGLVTVEDLVEEIVGEILSEGETPAPAYRREADGSVLIPAATPIHELSRDLEIDLPDPESASTVGGLAIELAGRIPVVGEKFPVQHWVLEIAEASHRRVKAVRIRPAPADEPPPTT
jgi:putative hemolysin